MKDKKKSEYKRFAGFGKQRIVTWLAYVAIVALSVVMSLGNYLFDLENFDGVKFATKVSISVAIAILVILMSSKDGKITNEGKEFGRYAEAKASFKAKRSEIVDLDSFRQWADGPLYERERRSAITDILAEYRIDDYNYMLVGKDDFADLAIGPKECVLKGGETVLLDQLSETQHKAVKYLREGFRFKALEYSYFTSSANAGGYAYYASLQTKQRRRKVFAIAYRVFMIVVSTAALMLTVFSENEGGVAQAVYDTTSRLVTLVSSAFMGYSLANDEMMEDMSAINFKIEKMDQYLVELRTGQFVPKSKDERIREKIRDIEKEREEEAKRKAAETIIPEVVGQKPNPEYMEIEMTEDEYKAYASK